MINKIFVKNMGGIREVSINFQNIPPGVIALVGPNGSAKSSLFDALAMALFYREMVSRDPKDLKRQVQKGYSLIADIQLPSNGNPYRLKQWIPEKGKEIQYEIVCAKTGQCFATCATEYDAWVSENIGSKELFMASQFGAQGGDGSILEMERGKRRALFREMLPELKDMQELSQKAKRVADEADREYGPRSLEHIAARTKFDTEQQARMELSELKKQDDSVLADVQKQAVEKQVLEAQLEEIEKRIRSTQEAIDRCRVSDTVDHLVFVRDECAVNCEKIKEQLAALGDPVKHKEHYETEISRLLRLFDVNKKTLLTMQQDQDAQKKVEAQYEQTKYALGFTDGQIENLSQVPCGGVGIYASCKFLANARKALSDRPAIEEKLRNLEAELQDRILDSELEYYSVNFVDPARSALAAAERAMYSVEADVARQKNLLQDQEKWKKKLNEADEALVRRQAQGPDDGVLRAKLMKEVSDLQKQHLALKGQIGTVTVELQEAEQKRRDFSYRIGKLEGILKDSVSEADLQAMKIELDALNRRVLQYRFIERMLGVDGVQKYELAASGPHIEQIANEALAKSYGDRFQVFLRTQVPMANGKGMKEEVSIQVFDRKRGVTDKVENFCGGEKTILLETIADAIAIFRNRKHPTWDVLYRDEPSAALSDENAPDYMKMMKVIRRMAGMHHVILITHQKNVSDAADTVLRMSDGRLTVE